MKKVVLTAALAVLMLVSASASAQTAHYMVFEVDESGRIEPVFYQLVEMQAPADPARDLPVQQADTDGEIVKYELYLDGKSQGFSYAKLPRMRGEFAKEPGVDDRIQSVQPGRSGAGAFVIRVAVDTADTIRFEHGPQPQTYSIESVAAQRAMLREAATVPFDIGLPAEHGPPGNRVDLLVLGDGYTGTQKTSFENDAANLKNALFAFPPYREYRNFVNWVTLFSPSSQSGASHPPYQPNCTSASCCSDPDAQSDPFAGRFTQTAFDSTFCTNQIHRLLTVNQSKVLAAAAGYPDWDQILVLVNDEVYGGSGGFLSVTSTNQYADQIVLHELGHSFSGLADEYDTPYPGLPPCSDTAGGSPCEPNVTNQTSRSQIKWASWISPGTAVPTPPGTPGVGLFEGARYQSTGMYRPVDQCQMRQLGVPFCPVCREQYIRRLYTGGWGTPQDGIDLIEPGSEQPAPEAPVQYTVGTSISFTVDLLWPQESDLDIEWLLDGVPVTGSWTESFTFSQDTPWPEQRTLELRVRDADTNGYLSDPVSAGLPPHQRTWTIEVAGELPDEVFHDRFQ